MKILLLIGALLAAGALAVAVVLVQQGPDPIIAPSRTPESVPADPAAELPVGDPMSVTGRVVDAAGSPLAAVDVYLLSPEDPLVPADAPRRVRTGEDGTFVLRGREGERLDVIAYRAGFRPGVVPDVSPGTTHRLTLPIGRILTGAVIDDSGRALSGVRITARSSGTNIVPRRGLFRPNHATLEVTWARTLSGSDGKFRLAGLGDGLLDITAEKRGFPGMEFPLDGFDPAAGTARIVMLRPFTASITVRDAESSEPLPRVAVTISRIDAEEEQAVGRTNHRGVFTGRMPWPAAQAPDCKVSIVAWDRRYGEIRADGIELDEVEDGKGFTLHAIRREPGVVRIHVEYDTGEAYEEWLGFRFEVGPKIEQYRGGRADEDGFVTMEVPAGTYRSVRVAAGGTAGRAALSGVTVISGETVEESLVVARGGDLEIRFEGEEVAEHVVGMVRLEARGFEERRGVWGRGVTIRDLPPGDLEVSVELRDYRPVSRTVQITKGKTAEFVMTLHRR